MLKTAIVLVSVLCSVQVAAAEIMLRNITLTSHQREALETDLSNFFSKSARAEITLGRNAIDPKEYLLSIVIINQGKTKYYRKRAFSDEGEYIKLSAHLARASMED